MTERPHGYRRYKAEGCRCKVCRYEHSRYRAEYRQGRGAFAVDYVPAELVRDHLRALSAEGLGSRRLAVMVGVQERTIRNWRRGATRLARKDLAERVLAITADGAPRRYGDITGTQRRLCGLAALGWPVTDLSARLGWDAANLMRLLRRTGADPTTAAKVAALYDELSMVVPAESTPVKRARLRAVRNMWFKPLAWDDDRIDDPAALPCLLPPVEPVGRDLEMLVQHLAAGHPVEPTTAAVREVIRRMPGAKPAEIARVARRDARSIANIRSHMKAAAC